MRVSQRKVSLTVRFGDRTRNGQNVLRRGQHQTDGRTLYFKGSKLLGEVTFHLGKHPSLWLLGVRLFYRELCSQRIEVFPVSKQSKVEMRSSGEASSTHVSDHLSTRDGCSSLQSLGYTLEMRIKGVIRARVIDTDAITEPTIPVCVYDFAACYRTYRSANWSSEIDAEVGTDTLQYRVHPRVGKHRRDASKLKRIAKELSTRDTRTFSAPLSSCEREERKSLAFVDNLRSQNLSILEDLPIAPKLLKDDFERVPGP
jgi:hypothetical protein